MENKGFITANTILDSMGDEQKTKDIYLNESSPDSTYWIYKEAIDENTRKNKILEIFAQEENKEKIFSKIIINEETIDIIFSNTNENIHSKLALELTEYMNNEWFKDIFICFKEMWKVISDDTKNNIADTIMKKYFGKQFVLLMFDDRMISENKDYINKLIKYWMDSEKKSITEIMLFRLNTEPTKVIWKSFEKEMQLSIIYDILHNCIRYSEYGLFWEIWDVSYAEIQKETIFNLTKILMKEIMISEGEFRTRELCEIICGMWKSADKNVMDSELSNLIELVSSNNEAFYHILLRCFSDLDEKQYNIIMEKVKNNPEKLDIFIYFVSKTNYGQKILVKEKQCDNYYEKEFIKAVIYYLLAMQIESLEDGLEKFSQVDGKEWCNSIIETMPKYHPARICYDNISLEDRDFDKMKSVALVKIAMYQMIREHDSLKDINSEADVDSLVEYISNGYNENNVSSQIKLYKNILEKNKDKLDLYLRIFEKYCDNDEYKKIVAYLDNESNETLDNNSYEDVLKVKMDNMINLKKVLQEYNYDMDSIINFSIGYDDKIYILLKDGWKSQCCDIINGSNYSMIVLDVDWQDYIIKNTSHYRLGTHKKYFYHIQPIMDKILLVGSDDLKEDENYTSDDIIPGGAIVDYSGKVIKEISFGECINDCIVLDNGNIITSYGDEGIFGNVFAGGNSGLSVWNMEGNSVWDTNRDVSDCYAINIDSNNDLWYYYYTDFDLIHTDLKDEKVYDPKIEYANGFLLNDAKNYIIFAKRNREQHVYYFIIENFMNEKIENKKKLNFEYNNENIKIKDLKFRKSKAVFIDEEDRMFLKWFR